MFDKKFLEATAERAVKTFVQTFAALITAGSFDLISASALDAAQVSLGAALLSVLTSLGSAKIGTYGPSLAGEEISIPLSVVTDQLKAVVEEEIIKPAAAKAKPAAKKKAAPKKPAAK